MTRNQLYLLAGAAVVGWFVWTLTRPAGQGRQIFGGLLLDPPVLGLTVEDERHTGNGSGNGAGGNGSGNGDDDRPWWDTTGGGYDA
jgi:hypothetical protein